ncbi:hypothetical protein ACGFNX_15740 [Streptomyces sp. NPDC048723]|uniref:hypothetical protein n=1 Tax=Streptomyces sp. NPDC048723 TaxID=3365589 RepID=UPI00371C4CFD
MSFTQIYDPATGRLLNTQLKKQDSAAPVNITDYTYTPAGDVTCAMSARGGQARAAASRAKAAMITATRT